MQKSLCFIVGLALSCWLQADAPLRAAEDPLLQFPALGEASAQGNDEVVEVDAGFTTPAADGSAQLVVTATIKSGWHIYSITQKLGGVIPSKVKVDKADAFQLLDGFKATVAPDVKNDPAFPGIPLETHEGKVTWFAPIKIAGNPQGLKILGKVKAQACNDQNCKPPQDFEFSASLSKDLPLQKAAEKAPPVTPDPAPAPVAPPASRPGAPPASFPTTLTGQGAAPFSSSSDDSVVAVDASFTTPAADGSAQLVVTATIKDGWHIYSITQGTGGVRPSTIKVDKGETFQLLGGFQATVAPDVKNTPDLNGLPLESHEGKVSWFAPIKVVGDPKAVKIVGRVNAQACNEQKQRCMPPTNFEFTASLSNALALQKASVTTPPAVPTAPLSRSSTAKQDQLTWQPFTSMASLGSLLGQDVDLQVVQDFVASQARAHMSILRAILGGFLGGLILNIMPCVLPVIGLKIMSFIEQSGHNRRKAFMLNAWYSLGLLTVFFALALLAVFANFGWGELFARPWFIISLAGLVFTMGLSFLDVWEIPIPGFAGRSAESGWANKEGATGAFVKGALTTVLATPCTAPYLAPALVWAAAQPPWLTFAIFLSAGLGMSSPYLLIGAFPELMSFLPKPGKWMETFKHIMGFVLMGTVVFFLTTLDQSFVVPTVGMLFALWAACWWVGRVSPVASHFEKRTAWAQAGAFAVVVVVLMFPAIEDLAGPRFRVANLTSIMRERLAYMHGVLPGRQAAEPMSGPPVMVASRPRAIMIDFTAEWCSNCKDFERNVLNQPAVIDAVQRHNVRPMRADWTDEGANPDVTRLLAVLNAGRPQIPVLAIFNPKNPNHPIVFPGPCSQVELIEAINKVAPLDKADVVALTLR